MAELLSVDNVYRFVVTAAAQGQQIMNIMHYRADVQVGATILDLQTALVDLANNWGTILYPKLSTEYIVKRFQLWSIIGNQPGKVDTNGNPLTYVPLYGTLLEQAGGAADHGTLAGAIVPTFNAVTFRKRTTRPSKRYRGGMRVGPIRFTELLDNDLTAAAVTDWQTVGTALKAPVVVEVGKVTLIPVVFSLTALTKKPRPVTEPKPVNWTADIVDMAVSTIASSQVSRKERKKFGD